ncbi:MAG TPA: TIGR03435 family protein [Vicinamibacterales bacterium]|nr:TIGR03435 family protein [Vicinamibacterales bacterium]
MDGSTTLQVLFGLGMGAAACLVVVNGQTPAPPKAPAFEVASIKENVSASENASVRAQPGGRVSVNNNSLRNIIRNAYNVQNYQIVGGPDWINTTRWDIAAKAPDDAPPQQLLLMLRTLLADRFKLVARNEQREMPIYALTLARPDGQLGPQLRSSSTDCAVIFAAAKAKGETPPPTTNGRPTCGTRTMRGNMMTTGVAMTDLARNLAPFAGRPVVDKTGLSGVYDLELTWVPEPGPSGPEGTSVQSAPSSDGVSLFTAVQEQLGLKLDAQRGQVDVLVIDSAQRPVED